jgi:predicted enzyme related to lactoylglutathione lyase
MAKHENAPGAPCWVDLSTSDPDRSRAFYEELFGWTAKEAGEEYGGYVNFLKDGEMVAGAMRNDGSAGTPDRWSIYLATDDAKATVEAAASQGGQVLLPAMEVMQLGSMAVVADVGGAAIGIWQPGLHTGFGILAVPGAPAWFELQTRDYDASVSFYRGVFGWDAHASSDNPELRYTTLGEGADQRAGIMDASAFLPDGVPASWSVYFAVDDADAALATTVSLGGSIVEAAQDTPYGRLAVASDPTGAVFKLIQLPS